jgi:hypothetical protein
MTKYFAFLIIIALRIMYQPGHARVTNPPFASQVSSFSHPVKLQSVAVSINNHRVFLNWTVSENEKADLFEIEKSTDGKKFILAALVFGSDKAETGHYQFYEKAGKKKMHYRVKLINKNKEIEYSTVVKINPPA